jgi:hypothetical protein
MPATKMQEPKSTAPYHPGLGELMTAIVQPRHIKLALAGKEQNWPYAAYQLGELTETFDDIAKLVPKHGNLSIPEAIASTVKQPLAALDAAIKARHAAAFTEQRHPARRLGDRSGGPRPPLAQPPGAEHLGLEE